MTTVTPYSQIWPFLLQKLLRTWHILRIQEFLRYDTWRRFPSNSFDLRVSTDNCNSKDTSMIPQIVVNIFLSGKKKDFKIKLSDPDPVEIDNDSFSSLIVLWHLSDRSKFDFMQLWCPLISCRCFPLLFFSSLNSISVFLWYITALIHDINWYYSFFHFDLHLKRRSKISVRVHYHPALASGTRNFISAYISSSSQTWSIRLSFLSH